jgi:hypothetical protein
MLSPGGNIMGLHTSSVLLWFISVTSLDDVIAKFRIHVTICQIIHIWTMSVHYFYEV